LTNPEFSYWLLEISASCSPDATIALQHNHESKRTKENGNNAREDAEEAAKRFEQVTVAFLVYQWTILMLQPLEFESAQRTV
jgi:hypothetical protein